MRVQSIFNNPILSKGTWRLFTPGIYRYISELIEWQHQFIPDSRFVGMGLVQVNTSILAYTQSWDRN